MPIWMTARNRPGRAFRRRTRLALRIALIDELLEAAAADRDQGDLGRREDAIEQDQHDDDPELDQRAAHVASPAGGSGRSGGDFARGSRIRAGTPTASLPGGTSRVTTAPAPVLAPSPMIRGATIIVSTPMNAPSPIVVAVLVRAVVVGGDRAGPDVDALADLGVAEVAHVVLLGAGAQAGVLELGEVADLRAAADDGARPEMAERPDPRLVLDDRRLDDARPDAQPARRSWRR